MFSVFLKAKKEIEAKVNNLQKTYLDLLNAPIREIQFKSHNILEKANQIIEEKLETLSEIRAEYEETLTQFEQIARIVTETKEVTEETESFLDFCFATFNIEIPEELQHKVKSPSQNTPLEDLTAHQSYQETDDEEDKENSHLYLEEEEEEEDAEESFDKENLQSPNSDDFFSPNVQFRKSSNKCFTPAIKSNKKPRPSFTSN